MATSAQHAVLLVLLTAGFTSITPRINKEWAGRGAALRAAPHPRRFFRGRMGKLVGLRLSKHPPTEFIGLPF
jgi:hypothetical protein